MTSAAGKLAARTVHLVAPALAIFIAGCSAAGGDPEPSAARLPARHAVRFIGSVDTMKLSRDRADTLSAEEIHRVVDLLARSMSTTHVTVDAPLEKASVIGEWANRIHAYRKRVWFRLVSTTCDQPHGDLGDGYPSYRPGYLTKLHELMRAHRKWFKPGDILDGDPEAENSCWWEAHYGCHVQSECTPCSSSPGGAPCAPIQQFNDFLMKMTRQENIDLAAMRIADVATNVHSVDPGTAMKTLTPDFVRSMHNLLTIDAYPDEHTTDPGTAADAWRRNLAGWHRTWLGRGLDVSILVGEWGYPLRMDVDDATQRSVLQAEVSRAFRSVRYLAGTNYWVGPGHNGDGGFTQILRPDATGGWRFRPAAALVSRFYAEMNRARRRGPHRKKILGSAALGRDQAPSSRPTDGARP